MRSTTKGILAALLAALLGAGALARAEGEKKLPKPEPRPRVEVVFVLDTTGSMSGLIEGAKRKIWSMVNRIVSGDPVPEVRVGLVAYRDRGDDYVTRITKLTDDLDSIYATLREYVAQGGGDTPESVNEALFAAVTKMDWSRDDRTLRLIFLVGDAPPHMDYPGDVKYPVTCEKAARAGIIINTIQCGAMASTTPIWREIAGRAEGRYVRIDQSGGMRAVTTPFDKRLADLDRALSGTAVFYGAAGERKKAKEELDRGDEASAAAPAEAASGRAGFRAKSGRISARDLLGMLEAGDLTLEKIDPKLLPEELAKLSPEDRTKRIRALLEKRAAIRRELLALDAKREEYLKEKIAKQGGPKDAFDAAVLSMLREQAKKIGVKYE